MNTRQSAGFWVIRLDSLWLSPHFSSRTGGPSSGCGVPLSEVPHTEEHPVPTSFCSQSELSMV